MSLEAGLVDVDWCLLTCNRDWSLAIVGKVMNTWIPENVRIVPLSSY
jgi:hypothetical protein